MKKMATIYSTYEYIFDDVDFGIEVRDWRQRNGMTQAEFAEAIGDGHTSSYVSMMECGRLPEGLPMRTFVRVCNIIDKDPFHFFAMQKSE